MDLLSLINKSVPFFGPFFAIFVKVFGLEDSDCIGHEHYPGDLLHPNEKVVPTPDSSAKSGWWRRLLGR